MGQPLDNLIDVLTRQLVAEYLAEHEPANRPLVYRERRRLMRRPIGAKTLSLAPSTRRLD